MDGVGLLDSTQFPDLVLKLIDDEEKVVDYPFNGYWKDLGYANDYDEATRDFINMRSQFLPEGI